MLIECITNGRGLARVATWQEVDFSSTFWVQVHGLPALWNTEDNLRKIGSRLGTVIELDLVGDSGGAWKKIVRIRVDIPLGKPLFPGLFLPHPNNTDCWIVLKYEKLADVCYKCGVVGHEERSCTGTLYQICNPNGVRFKAAGPWLRPGYENPPPGIFKLPDSATNVTVELSGQPPKFVSSSGQAGTHDRASPEFVSSSVQVGTPERTRSMSCYTH